MAVAWWDFWWEYAGEKGGFEDVLDVLDAFGPKTKGLPSC